MTSVLFAQHAFAGLPTGTLRFDFCGDTLELQADVSLAVPFDDALTPSAIRAFHQRMQAAEWQPIASALVAYRDEKKLSDWLFYQLVRKTAQQLAPKADNYYRYTLFKWFFMMKSGYDAALTIRNEQLLFYIYSTDEIQDIPFYVKNNRQYVCLNIHDYAKASRSLTSINYEVDVTEPGLKRPFSYAVTRLPEFNPSLYAQKEIAFPYNNRTYHFSIRLNPQVKNLFTNYPVVDYASYFNIPLSEETYQSLVPVLKQQVKDMKVKKGVDYLMHFTRYGFLYEDDQANFGKEKRMGPEETLLSAASDCDDRAALFFYLVKEIYNMPMIALMYPTHITIAVQFEKPVGSTVKYEGKRYSICEPTPQGANHLAVGQVAPQYRNMPYQVVYAYSPR